VLCSSTTIYTKVSFVNSNRCGHSDQPSCLSSHFIEKEVHIPPLCITFGTLNPPKFVLRRLTPLSMQYRANYFLQPVIAVLTTGFVHVRRTRAIGALRLHHCRKDRTLLGAKGAPPTAGLRCAARQCKGAGGAPVLLCITTQRDRKAAAVEEKEQRRGRPRRAAAVAVAVFLSSAQPPRAGVTETG
jgi:hypothetical protein